MERTGTCHNWHHQMLIVILLNQDSFVFRNAFEKKPTNGKRFFECQMKGLPIVVNRF